MPDNIYTIKKGEQYPISIKMINKDLDKPIDLTGAEMYFQIKDELNDDFFIIDKKITVDSDPINIGQILDPTKGEFVVRLTDDDYDKLVVNRVYYLTIWYTVPSENFKKVVSSNGCDYLKFIVCHA